MQIPIFEPYLNGCEKAYLNQCVDTNWISSQGDFVLKFEKSLANYHGLGHAIATSSCTTALHLALKSLGIESGDEVLCPDLTFIAPANMILLCGARPVLVDIDPETLTIDPHRIEEKITSKTRSIMVVHQFGHAAHMDEIMAVAGKYNLTVIEDNAESIGAGYKGRLLGTIGHVSTLSFFSNKIITCGEGGAVLTDDPDLARRCQILRDHGMAAHKKYHHIDLGYNYRMTNMQAAIGLAQVEALDRILVQRRNQMALYYQLLADVPGIRLRSFQDWCNPVHWMMTLTLDRQYHRDKFLHFMKSKGIDCRQMVNPVHRANHFADRYRDADFPHAVRISLQSVHLPSSTALAEEQIRFISENVKQFLA